LKHAEEEVLHTGADGDVLFLQAGGTPGLSAPPYAIADIFRPQYGHDDEHWDVASGPLTGPINPNPRFCVLKPPVLSPSCPLDQPGAPSFISEYSSAGFQTRRRAQNDANETMAGMAFRSAHEDAVILASALRGQSCTQDTAVPPAALEGKHWAVPVHRASAITIPCLEARPRPRHLSQAERQQLAAPRSGPDPREERRGFPAHAAAHGVLDLR